MNSQVYKKNIKETLKLRCRFRTGQFNLNDLTINSTVDELLGSITKLLGISRSGIVLFYGYPPKKLVCSDQVLTKRLSELPLQSGDTVTVDTVAETGKLSPNISNSKVQIPSHEVPVHVTPERNIKNSSPHIVRLKAPSDNSCLFTSVLFCVDNQDSHMKIGTEVVTNTTAVAQLRELISGIVLSDPVTYSEAFLGMPNQVYSQKIQEPDRWGGGIEVSILSQLYEVEICIVDIESCRIDRFGEDKTYPRRILLMYDGIHYDPLALERPDLGCLVSVFRTSDDTILLEAQELASDARAEWAFTNLSAFTLLCGQCDMPLVGQAAAQKHAQETGHTQFREIPR